MQQPQQPQQPPHHHHPQQQQPQPGPQQRCRLPQGQAVAPAGLEDGAGSGTAGSCSTAAAAPGDGDSGASDAIPAILLPVQQVIVPLEERRCKLLAFEALRCAALTMRRPTVLYGRPLPSGGDEGEAADSAAAEWWGTAVQALHLVASQCLEDVHAGILGPRRRLPEHALQSLLAHVPAWPAGHLQPSPPPNLAAALSAGYLPLLERLLRAVQHSHEQRALAPAASTAVTTATTTAAVSPSELLQPFCAWPLLGRLLAYGEPRQAAALLATAAKLIGRLSEGIREEQAAALSRSILSGDRAGPCDGGVQAVLRRLPLQDMLCWLAAAAAEQQQPHGFSAAEEPAAAAAEAAVSTGKEDGMVSTSAAVAESSVAPPSGQGGAQGAVREGDPLARALGIAPPLPVRGPRRQLLSMIACAARRWLPPLSRLAIAGGKLQAVGAPGGSEPAGVTAAGHVLRWVPVLVHAAAQQEEGEQRPGAGAAPPAAPTPASGHSADGLAPAAGGRPPTWLLLLLAGGDVVGLLGRTLRQLGGDEAAAGGSAASFEATERLHEACVALECVAAAFPREVAAALADGRLPPLHRAPGALLGGAAAAQLPPAQLPPAQLQQRERLLSALDGAAAWASSAATPSAATAAARLLPDFCVGGDGTAPASKVSALLLAAAAKAPGERGALLTTCSNPLCASLAGDSEADLTLRACGGCGRPRYCCPACQKAHWRAGHRAECARQDAAVVVSAEDEAA
ncbi:hypothetical protein TSOC_008061 [Tetrabaena socialis]|uniref:phytol kinase n=1 Tax=Tetrabaena socialis TaxID=47790 RepID=A0A2J7ZZH8_9CHLO|nr:hypothetical protein TSOC_008061 [Tetrabaena socialis]|eukprot:PNH05656.1 hypothetical protein TSOC_008061 [Tetrabaena socialis]